MQGYYTHRDTMTELDLSDEDAYRIDNVWETTLQSLHIACPTRDITLQLTHRVYDNNSGDEALHIEHYPVTDDETGTVDHYALFVIKLSYDPDTGWHSGDLADEPDIDLRDRN